MSNSEYDSPLNNDGDDGGELAWNEFDWEHYLRAQDRVVLRYLACYEQLHDHPDRIDEVAQLMGWDEEDWSSEPSDTPGADAAPADDSAAGIDPYTLHKNPIFIATRALYLVLRRGWEEIAADAATVPQPLALTFHTALHRGEDQAMLAIQALDFGDYALAVSLFKRALHELNATLAPLQELAEPSPALAQFRAKALPCLFDLREIWLRVMAECREELEQPFEDGEA